MQSPPGSFAQAGCIHEWQEPEHLGPKMVAIGEDINIGFIPDYTEPLSNSLDMSMPLESQLEKIIEYYANRCEQITNQLHNKEPKMPIKFIPVTETDLTMSDVEINQFFVSLYGQLCQKVSEGAYSLIAQNDGMPEAAYIEHEDGDDARIMRILPKIKKIEF